MITEIIKRNGRLEAFKQEKIVHAIFKAATACGGSDYERAEVIGTQVVELLERDFRDKQPDVESIQDIVEKVLIGMFSDYLGDKDWQISENANTQKSVNGLNNYSMFPPGWAFSTPFPT